MKSLTQSIIPILGILILFSGCSFQAPGYAVSPSNLESIKLLSGQSQQKVSVGEFTADFPNQHSINCRGNFPGVGTSNDQPFHSYIRDALINELKLGGYYSENSENIITAHLQDIDYDSLSGYWIIDMKVFVSGAEPFEINIKHDYDTSFIYWIACPRAARELVPAVQKFNEALINKLR